MFGSISYIYVFIASFSCLKHFSTIFKYILKLFSRPSCCISFEIEFIWIIFLVQDLLINDLLLDFHFFLMF